MTPFLALFTFMAIAVCLASADGDNNKDAPPDFSGFGDNKPCPGFRCSAGQGAVQKSRAKFVSKGCSKMGGGMIAMGGGMGGGNEPYAVCCDRWHACYQTCGAPKQSCDDAFKSCSADICAGDEECKKGADMNSMLLGLGGCGLYDQGQYGACECVPKDKREEKRASALRAFYKKFAPEALDKVEALAKKVESSAKLSAVFRKLHVKYPKSINVVVDDEMARMQEMMNKAKDSPKAKDVVVEDEDDAEADDGETEEL